jgi:hypothetical protein
MDPVELRDIANGFVTIKKDENGKETLVISQAKLTLSAYHAGQFDELVGKLMEAKALTDKDKPKVIKLDNQGALLVSANDLVRVLALAREKNIQLDVPQ